VRALLGWLLLLSCCGLVGLWQLRAERGLLAEVGADVPRASTISEREGTWRTLTLGRPSGASPLEVEGLLPPEGDSTPPLPDVDWTAPDDQAEPPSVDPQPFVAPADFEYTVPKGRVLSKICEEFYGTGRAPVPQRVAEYNQMGSPDELSAGQVLKLPAWERLFPDGRERP
jgi:nucleoid-associated protein YgaU